MELTFIGAAIAVIGLILLVAGSPLSLMILVMMSALMSGSAAVILPSLGGSSIPPAPFALIFLLARLVLPGSGNSVDVRDGLRANLPFAIFAIYGIAMAAIGPRLFAGALFLTPMRPIPSADLFAAFPLVPTAQNITTPIYIVGGFLTAMSISVAIRQPGGARIFAKVATVICWAHIYLGVSAIALKGTGYTDFLALFRNGTYGQLSQEFGGFVRITGIMPEPSSYAAFAFAWLVFMFEAWIRNVLPRRTGVTALSLVILLVFSTSSTAYVALAGYAVILAGRALLFPRSFPTHKGIYVFGALLIGFIATTGALVFVPAFAQDFGKMLTQMTVGKQDSESGLQRAFWAQQGLTAFSRSWGLGIGPGSFRSSSIVTALLGSVGIVGTSAFVILIWKILKPLRASTYAAQIDQSVAVGVAAGWAAIVMLIPAALTGPSPDPGIDFAIFAGAALSLRTFGDSRSRSGASDDRTS